MPMACILQHTSCIICLKRAGKVSPFAGKVTNHKALPTHRKQLVSLYTWLSFKGDLMRIPPTSKQVTATGIAITRVLNGKVVEQWANYDDLGLLQQLGVIPSMG
jgi:hypothetical protein